MRAAALVLLAAAGLAGCYERTSQQTTLVFPEGTPCPTTTAAVVQERGLNLRQTVDMGLIRLDYQAGRANCEAAGTSGEAGRDGIPVCLLSGPGMTRVTTGSAEFYFDIMLGNPAAITLSEGQPRCVLTQGS